MSLCNFLHQLLQPYLINPLQVLQKSSPFLKCLQRIRAIRLLVLLTTTVTSDNRILCPRLFSFFLDVKIWGDSARCLSRCLQLPACNSDCQALFPEAALASLQRCSHHSSRESPVWLYHVQEDLFMDKPTLG